LHEVLQSSDVPHSGKEAITLCQPSDSPVTVYSAAKCQNKIVQFAANIRVERLVQDKKIIPLQFSPSRKAVGGGGDLLYVYNRNTERKGGAKGHATT
jgi:hypothetical protein